MRLGEAGKSPLVLDKGRGVGGRLSTRRATVNGPTAERQVRFDHGAPAVRPARADLFSDALLAAASAGVAAPWSGSGEPGAVVGVPGMRDLVAHWLAPHTVSVECTVTALTRVGARWRIDIAHKSSVEADAIILTVPAPQCRPLVASHSAEAEQAAESARYAPCWTGMLAFAESASPALSEIAADGLTESGIEAVIRNGEKPGRDQSATLVIHANADLSRELLENERDQMADFFTDLAVSRLGLPQPELATAHRWRYCRVERAASLSTPSFADNTLAVAGDWTSGRDASDAFMSGVAAADALLSGLAHA